MEEVKGIYKKMLTIMDNVGYILKDMNISYGTTSYKALSEEAVLTAVRKHLIAQDVYVYCIHQVHSRVGNLTSVDEVFRFVDLDDGSYIDIHSSGEGADTQDKGVGKAQTYSFKYLFRRAFAIPTGDDPDRVSSKELDDKDKENAVGQGKRSVMQMLEDNPGLDDDYKNRITQDVDEAFGKQDIDSLRDIYRDVETEARKNGLREAKERDNKPPLPKGKPAKSELDTPEQDLF